MKLAFVAAGMMTAGAVSSDVPPPDAKPYVAQLYKRYKKGNILFENPDQIYSPHLVKLMQREAHATHHDMLLTDPLCECTEYNVNAVKVAVNPAANNTAIANVSFRNFGKTHKVELILVPVNHQWRVDDVKSHGLSFQDHLRDNIQAADAANN